MNRIASVLLLFTFLSPASAKTLNVRLTDAPVSLDWNGTASMTEAPLILNLCEGLFTYEYPSGKLIPGIAESLTKSKDATEYTFKIRKDAKWSDGKAIVAQDFVEAWTRVLSPQSTSTYVYYLFDIKKAKEFNSKSARASELGLKAIDEHTLFVKLKRPSPNWEVNTTFWPLFPNRKDQIEKFGSNWWRAGILVSSGPFLFDTYEAGKKIVFKKNPEYKRSHGNIDEIDFHIVSNQDEALKKYDDGFFDFLWGLSSSASKYKDRTDYKIQNIMRADLLGLNTEKFPMTNVDFRKAILQSLNPAKLIPAGANQLRFAQTFIPPPLAGSKTPTVSTFDVKAAQESLKKSGIATQKLKLRILTNSSEPYASIGKLIQAQIIAALGLNVEVISPQSQEYSAYMDLGDYNATVLTWTAKVLSPQDFLLPYSGDAIFNRLHFTNPFYDQWIFEGVRSTTPKEAETAFHEAQKVLGIEDAVASPLFFESYAELIRPKLKALYFNHMGVPILKDVEITGK